MRRECEYLPGGGCKKNSPQKGLFIFEVFIYILIINFV